MDQDKRHDGSGLSLAFKLNLIVVTAIIVVSVGLVGIGFKVYGDKIIDVYHDRMDNAIANASYYADPDALAFLWDCMQTTQFEQARQQALESNDEEPLWQWMRSVDARSLAVGRDEADFSGHVYAEYETLEDIYLIHVEAIESLQDSAGITSAYIQVMRDGVTYDLIDPQLGCLVMGSVEDPLPEFAGYGDNEAIPPTVYESQYGFLCTAAVTLYRDNTHEAVAMFCLDDDMSQAMSERNEFLWGSVRYVALAMIVVLAASLYLVRRIVTRPVRQLTEATCSFYGSGSPHDADGIVDPGIFSNDEIGDLYREIRSMQGRIAEYTQDLARISAEEERARTELRMASSIQESVMPNLFPVFPDRQEFEVYASMDAAKDVGGDFYDFFLVDDDHLALVIADVSGKGIPAALFMMAVKIMIDDRAVAGGTPAQILASVNRKVCSRNTTRTFVTVWMGILDIRTGELTCSNAGHGYPWVRGADGSFRMLRDKHSLVVGGSKKTKYVDYTIQLEPGDALFVHTDGVNEAVNPAHEFFGNERLAAALNAHAGAGPVETLRSVLAEVDAFADGADRFDDLTMLCVEYHGPNEAALEPGDAADQAPVPAAGETVLPATAEGIQQAIDFVSAELDRLQCPAPARMQVVMAVDEIAGNIAKFAYDGQPGTFTVRFSVVQEGDAAQIEFVDQGRAFNPLEECDPDTTSAAGQRPVGGLGIFLVKKTMDAVEYERRGERNCLRICKRIVP